MLRGHRGRPRSRRRAASAGRRLTFSRQAYGNAVDLMPQEAGPAMRRSAYGCGRPSLHRPRCAAIAAAITRRRLMLPRKGRHHIAIAEMLQLQPRAHAAQRAPAADDRKLSPTGLRARSPAAWRGRRSAAAADAITPPPRRFSTLIADGRLGFAGAATSRQQYYRFSTGHTIYYTMA